MLRDLQTRRVRGCYYSQTLMQTSQAYTSLLQRRDELRQELLAIDEQIREHERNDPSQDRSAMTEPQKTATMIQAAVPADGSCSTLSEPEPLPAASQPASGLPAGGVPRVMHVDNDSDSDSDSGDSFDLVEEQDDVVEPMTVRIEDRMKGYMRRNSVKMQETTSLEEMVLQADAESAGEADAHVDKGFVHRPRLDTGAQGALMGESGAEVSSGGAASPRTMKKMKKPTRSKPTPTPTPTSASAGPAAPSARASESAPAAPP